MQGSMLHTAVVPVHLTPIIQCLFGCQRLVVVGVHIPEEIPAGACPLGHGIGFPLGVAAALGALAIDPINHGRQRTLAVVGGLIALHLRQHQGQLALRQGHGTALGTMNNGNGLAPIALTGEYPVPELIVDLALADALLLQPLGHSRNCLVDGHAVEEIGVHEGSGIVLGGKCAFGNIAAGYHLNDVAAELLGKGKVAVIMGRHCHDCAGAVGGKHIVGDENGNMLAVDGIDGINALQLYAGFILHQLGTLKVGLPGCLGNICLYLIVVGDLLCPFLHIGMLRRNDHIGCTEQGVGTGGIDPELMPLRGFKIHLCAGGTTDPVSLLGLDALDVVHILQTVQQLLGILGDSQHPLGLFLPHHRRAAALAHALDYFLVGKHALAAGAPVHGHGRLIRQSVFVELEENPLGPLIIIGVRGIDDPIPVEGIAQHMELTGKVLDILPGYDGRMDMVFDCKVLGGQTKGVEADGEQYVFALHALFPGNGVHCRVGTGMPYMQTCAGGVGKLHQCIEFFLIRAVFRGKHLAVSPDLLPFLFDGSKIIFHRTSPEFLPFIPHPAEDIPPAGSQGHRPKAVPDHRISAAPG